MFSFKKTIGEDLRILLRKNKKVERILISYIWILSSNNKKKRAKKMIREYGEILTKAFLMENMSWLMW